METHLDWCPTCDRQIMPRRYVVPVEPSPQPQKQSDPPPPTNLNQLPTVPPAPPVKSSQTTRGKHGTIKARVQGGGLLQGTGRVRPGGLRRESDTSDKTHTATTTGQASRNRSPQKPQAQQQQQAHQKPSRQQQQRSTNSSATAQNTSSPAAGQPQRTMIVIDQSPTPLYCSEECRLADKNAFNLAAMTVGMGKRVKTRLSILPHGASDLHPDDRMRSRMGPHPSQINPVAASPPPASPVIPPAPPNSVLGVGSGMWEMLPPPDKLARALSEADTSSSSDSSDSGRSFGTSNASEHDLQTRPAIYDPKLTDPPPPDVEPLPLHPHRPSAPVRNPPNSTARRSASSSGQESGLFTAARRFSSIFRSKESIEREKMEEDQRQLRSLGRALFDPSRAPRGVMGHDLRPDSGLRREEEDDDMADEPRSFVASTHRHALPVEAGGTMGSEKLRAEMNRAIPSRTQSSVELFSQLFSAGSGKGRKAAPRPALPSISTSLTSVHASSSRHNGSSSLRSSSSSTSPLTATERLLREYQISPEEEPLYEGKRFSLRHEKAKATLGFPELKGLLILSDELLNPPKGESFLPLKPSSAPGRGNAFRPERRDHPIRRTLSGGNRREQLLREASEVSVSRSSVRSELGILKEEGEEGEWHTQKYAESETGSGSVVSDDRGRLPDSRSEGGNLRLKPHRKSKTSRSVSATSHSPTKNGAKKGQLAADSRNWSYDNFPGPLYTTMPRIPTTSFRVEEEFVPDDDTRASRTTPFYIAKLSIYEEDNELERKELRELGRKRGEFRGQPGWWVDKEWEIKSIPKFKRLFFNSPETNSANTSRRKTRSPA